MILISEEIKEDWNCGYQIKNKILEIVGTNKAEVFLLGEIWGTIFCGIVNKCTVVETKW